MRYLIMSESELAMTKTLTSERLFKADIVIDLRDNQIIKNRFSFC